MYIKKLNYKNIGPISNLDIDMPFNEDDNPKPFLIVGENGSGKSLVLSSVVDSLYEFGGIVFENITKSKNNNGHFYFKLSGNDEIKLGESFTSSYILFDDGTHRLEYLSKVGNKQYDEWLKESNLKDANVKWNSDNDTGKYFTNNKEICSKLFEDNICCYFPPNRYSRPIWLSSEYFEESRYKPEMSIKEKYLNYNYNQITVENSYIDNISWLLDIICDSRIDVDITRQFDMKHEQFSIPGYVVQNDIKLLKVARQNIELVLTTILKKDVFLRAGYRGKGLDRVYLVDSEENKILPSLASLSTGQMALFNMFLNIIRYADNNDLNKSIKLKEIKGIVIIDEIELHLHTDLQYEVLPKLIKLFPKVQFLITTHSPLFILGMVKYYGKKLFDVMELPQGVQIDSEEFSQFLKAYDMFKDSKKYRHEIEAIKRDKSSLPLIITEGPSDWIHIKNALEFFAQSENTPDNLKESIRQLSVKFLEFYPKQGDYSNKILLNMGDGALISMCKQFSLIEQNRKYIFIGDRDKPETIKILNSGDETYKSWGNNVFSFCIPIPENRNINDICIEHYYDDNDLKTLILCSDGIKRRLYLSDEFDENGICKDENAKCENTNLFKSKGKIHILDGSDGKKVYINDISQLKDKESPITCETNLALSKIKFAEAIASKSDQFKNVNLSSFLKIIEILIEINRQ